MPGPLPERLARDPGAHSRVVLAPGLDADEQAQTVPGAGQFRPPLLWEGLEEVALVTAPHSPGRQSSPALPTPRASPTCSVAANA